jgi:hypothetical protein
VVIDHPEHRQRPQAVQLRHMIPGIAHTGSLTTISALTSRALSADFFSFHQPLKNATLLP